MGFHGGGWFSYMQSSGEKPRVTWNLMKRVLSYSMPYRWQILGMFATILVTTGLTLITPLILRDLIDHTIPEGNIPRLIGLSIALLFIPALNGAANVIQRTIKRPGR